MPGLSGPAGKPDGERRRRNATVPMLQLPANGYDGPIPEWPLLPDLDLQVQLEMAESVVDTLGPVDELSAADKRKLNKALEAKLRLGHQLRLVEQAELDMWRQLWRTPQAAAWARSSWVRDVAQYVRHKVRAEWGSLDHGKEARQFSDKLGLTPLAMSRLRWQVSSDEVGGKRQEKAAEKPKTARDRLRIADTGTE